MKIFRNSPLVAIASTLVVMALDLPVHAQPPSPPGVPATPLTAPSLPAYRVDIQQTSVSGVSAGGAMAVQMHVAHSSIMRGVGVTAGVAYDCADSRLPNVGLSLVRGISCMEGDALFGGAAGAAFSIARTTDAAGVAGAIDDPAVHLPRQKVWLFSGYNDGTVRRGAMNAVAMYYENYVSPGNVFYKNNNHAPHALVTDSYGGTCLGFNQDYINNCQYDAAGRLLQHIYGRLDPRSSSSGLSGSILAFDQSQFTGKETPKSVGLADTGYVYVPAACETGPCRAHVFFHGCQQYAGRVGDAVYRHAGYNEWADTNRLVVLYPQTQADPIFNPNGCWDWWGLSDALPLNRQFARKTGYQISAIKGMLDRLAGNFVPGGGTSDTFGAPQDFSVADSTATSVELIWQPNSAAAGFNIYRSSSSTGPYMKINSQPVKGASFTDALRAPSTTYYYQGRAVEEKSGQESPPTGVMSGRTAPEPPQCDPYFSNNIMHVLKLRAFSPNLIETFAAVSVESMGFYNASTFRQLIKKDGISYHVGYCP